VTIRACWAVLATIAVSPHIGLPERTQQAVFRAEVASVFVNVSVTQGNNPIAGLASENFIISDNGVRQTVDSMAEEAVPIDLTLFHDTSQSQAGRIEGLKDDVRRIAAMLRPGDRIRLITLDFQIKDVFGWQPAGRALDLSGVRFGRNSAVYDGIFAAIMHRPDPDRRHLIVALTDGIDGGSTVGSKAVLDAARHAEGVLHLVLLANRSSFKYVAGYWLPTGADRDGQERLKQAAEVTGGRVHTQILLANVVGYFRQAFDDFRQSYVLRYTPTGVARDGWHEIKVEVPGHPRATIRARKGYFGGLEALRPSAVGLWPSVTCVSCT
jgi:VWFA-related protein